MTSKVFLSPLPLVFLLPLALGLQPAALQAAADENTLGIPVTSLPYSINAPGVYRVMADLTNPAQSGAAIAIYADNVVLELNGHHLDNANPAGTVAGVAAFNHHNVTVRNGTLRGFGIGVDLTSTSAGAGGPSYGNLVEEVAVSGATSVGIRVYGDANVVRRCQVTDSGGGTYGADGNGYGVIVQNGVGSRVLDNDVDRVRAVDGAHASFGILFSLAAQCFAVSNRVGGADYGVYFDAGSPGKYEKNLAGASVGHAYTGGTDAGGNLAPVITGAASLAGQVGAGLVYQINASNAPRSYGASGLPPGLGVSATTGAISGTPTQAGSFTVGLTASNAAGTGAATLGLTINPPTPVITSAAAAGGAVGYAFSYQITAGNSPATFGAGGLPPGLNVDSRSGIISGTPARAGAFNLVLTAANAGGTGTAALSLTITAGDGAAFASQAVSGEMLVNQVYPVTVAMLNTGGTTWLPGRHQLACVSPDGIQPSCWNVAQAPLTSAVAPQQTATFTFTVTSPAAPGQYSFHWRMSAVPTAPQPPAGFGDPSSDYTVKVVGQASVAGALQNPGFEQPALPGGGYAATPAGAGWTFAGAAGVTANTSPYASPSAPAPEGTQAAYLGNTGSMSQATAPLPAGNYVVGFRAAQRGNPNNAQQIAVTADGVALGLFTPPGAGYSFYASAPFKAPGAGAVTLGFAGTNPGGGDNTALIDDVRVFPVAAGGGAPYGGAARTLPGRIPAVDFDEGGQDAGFGDTTPYNVFAASFGAQVYRPTAVDIGPVAGAGGGYTVGSVEPGEYLNYSVTVAAAGSYPLMARAGSLAGGTFRVEVDGADVTGPLRVPALGDWVAETNVTAGSAVTLGAGGHAVRVVSLTGGFNLDWLAIDAVDGGGLPNWWKTLYFGALNVDPNALSARGDGTTNRQAFERGLNPNDFYNGRTPHILVVGGTPQTGPPNGFVPLPLVVSVTDGNGNPFGGAPVTFTVGQGGGQVQRSSTASPGTSLTVLTDFSGQARIFFKLPALPPNVTSTTSQVTAATGSGGHLVSVTFSMSSDSSGGNGGGGYSSPFDPTNVTATLNADGSLDVTWTSHADPNDQTPISIQDFDANGVYHTIATAPAGSTSYHIPAR